MSVPRTRIVSLTRAKWPEGVTLFFTFDGGAGRGDSGAHFIDRDHVPPFEGDPGRFEIERVHGKPCGFDRAIRQVAPPERG